MGRKPDPRGKDRARTISLSGDVAEIAQKLADKNQLSKVLSDLLRQSYGFGEAIEERKQELASLIAERKSMQLKEEEMIASIEALEIQATENEATVRPALMTRIEILQNRYNKISHDLQRSYDSATRARKMKQHERTFDMLNAAKKELEELE